MDLKRFLFNFIMVFVLIYFQSVIEVFAVHPDLIMLYAITYSLLYGTFKGQIAGFLVGFLEDVLSGGVMGLNAFVKTVSAYLPSVYQKILSQTNFYSFIVFVISATVVKWLIFLVVGSELLGFNLPEVSVLKMIVEIVLNSVFAFPYFWFFSRRVVNFEE